MLSMACGSVEPLRISLSASGSTTELRNASRVLGAPRQVCIRQHGKVHIVQQDHLARGQEGGIELRIV